MTAHGLATGDTIIISGADLEAYNEIGTVTVTDPNTFTYTVVGTPATPATGSLVGTAQIMTGLTDANGVLFDSGFNFGTNQPVGGRARKSDADPFFKDSNLTGTITSNGLSITPALADD